MALDEGVKSRIDLLPAEEANGIGEKITQAGAPSRNGFKTLPDLDFLKSDSDAAMAKLYVSESFVKSCLDAVQIHGGAGFLTELEFEREVCESVGSTLYSGPSEIQRNIIARGLGI